MSSAAASADAVDLGAAQVDDGGGEFGPERRRRAPRRPRTRRPLPASCPAARRCRGARCSSSDSDAGSTLTGSRQRGLPSAMPASPARSSPATTRYGLAARSKALTSRFAAPGLPGEPVTSRNAASRFSRPQTWKAPAQWLGMQPQVARRRRARRSRAGQAVDRECRR